MSISIGAVMAGGAEGGGNAEQFNAKQQMDTDARTQLMQAQSDNDLARAKALADYQVQQQAQQRGVMSDAIAQRAGLIGQQMQASKLDNFYNQSLLPGQAPSNLVADPSGISDEERAMVPISPADAAQHAYLAAKQLGYITPDQSATIDSKAAILDAGNQRLQARLDSMEGMAADREAGRNDRAAATAERLQTEFQTRLAAAGGSKGSERDALTTQLRVAGETLAAAYNAPRPRDAAGLAAWQKGIDQLTALRDQAAAGLVSKNNNPPTLRTPPPLTGAPPPFAPNPGSPIPSVSSAVDDFWKQTQGNN